MKFIKIVCLSLLVSLVALSCKETPAKGKDAVTKTAQQESLKKIEVGIEGMTCQIGCAKIIESKLSKVEGVSSVSVSFENKLGQIVYDDNKISKEEIITKIEAIAGGKTYRITSVKEVEVSGCSKSRKTCVKKCSDTCTKADCEKCAVLKVECKTKCAAKAAGCTSKLAKACVKKCSDTCTKADCEKCAVLEAECKTKCAAKAAGCTSKLAKACVKKCSNTCTKADCEKCAVLQAECKTKCATKK